MASRLVAVIGCGSPGRAWLGLRGIPDGSHSKPGHLALAIDWRILMKSMILVALAVLSLGVGNAYAQGKPLSAHAGVYGSQS